MLIVMIENCWPMIVTKSLKISLSHFLCNCTDHNFGVVVVNLWSKYSLCGFVGIYYHD